MNDVSLLSMGLVFFVIAVSPGPATLSNATIAMSQGRRASLVYGAGLSAGLVFWGVIAASGMGVVLQKSVWVLMLLKVLGGMYLLWLAYSSGRNALSSATSAAHIANDSRSSSGWFARGLLLNMSNPKSVIAWMAALSVGVGVDDSTLTLAAGVTVCGLVGLLTNTLYSLLFSLNGVMQWYRRASRRINGVAAAVFAIGGLSLVRSAFSRAT